MFSSIDNKLINLAQWIVRQIELFTNMTRDDFCKRLLRVNRSIHIAGVALVLILPMIENIVLSIMLLICFTLVSPYTVLKREVHRELLRTQQKTDVLPNEIYIRKEERRRVFILVVSEILLFFLVVLPKNRELSPILVFCIIMILDFLTLSFEYLLCTTSLPPGEKERRMVKKEGGRMIPQATSG